MIVPYVDTYGEEKLTNDEKSELGRITLLVGLLVVGLIADRGVIWALDSLHGMLFA